MYYVYVLRTEKNFLYTGIAKDLSRRLREHLGKGKRGAKFTRSQKIVSLAALWTAPDRSTAQKLESAIKSLSKKEKERLVASPYLLTELLPAMEKEDYLFHPKASLPLFLGEITLCDLP